MTRWKFVKNAVANLGRGSAAALVAVILPPILVRHMSPVDYSVWVLVLQTVSYVGYLDFGLQTAIARYVAYWNEKRNFRQRDSVFSTAVLGLSVAAALGIILLSSIAIVVPDIFPSIPVSMIPVARTALLIVGVSVALGLPVSAWSGVFAGHHRFEVPALIIGGGRLLSAVGVVAVVLMGGSLSSMAIVVALSNVLSYVLHYLLLRRNFGDFHFQPDLVTTSASRELFGYCLGLSVMSLSMLLVTGLDLLLVGRFEFGAITSYSVSASLVTFISGALFAILSVVLPYAAGLHANESRTRLGDLVVSLTRVTVLALLVVGAPLFVYAGPILKAWIGAQFVAQGTPYLQILVAANVIRLIGAPFSMILVAVGKQNLVKISPLLEGTTNLIFSVILGSRYGAIGVAFGTLIGAVVGLAAHFRFSMPRTVKEIPFTRLRFMRTGVVAPLCCALPLALVTFLNSIGYRLMSILTISSFAFLITSCLTLLLRSDFLKIRKFEVCGIL